MSRTKDIDNAVGVGDLDENLYPVEPRSTAWSRDNREIIYNHFFKTIIHYTASLEEDFLGETAEQINSWEARAMHRYHNDPLFNARVRRCVAQLCNLPLNQEK